MSSEENKQRVLRTLNELWNKGNLQAIDELYASDYVGHNHASPIPLRGPAGLKTFVWGFHTSFSEVEHRVENVIAEGEMVAARWHTQARHTGALMHIAATNTRCSITGMTIARFRQGKIVESWDEWDQVGMFRQLGVGGSA